MKTLLYSIGSTEASIHATAYLRKAGIPITDHPQPEITHLLLDVPSFHPDGCCKSNLDLSQLLPMLPRNAVIIGGNLDHPLFSGHNCVDLLATEDYLYKNAALTAECALRVAAPYLKTIYRDTPTLVIGWGRIGKHLSNLLQSHRCPVTVAVRRESDHAALSSLGYQAVYIQEIPEKLADIALIFNTVPSPVLSEPQLSSYPDCTKIELASCPGLSGRDIVQARGLPGICAPESSGMLIADSILKILKGASQ